MHFHDKTSAILPCDNNGDTDNNNFGILKIMMENDIPIQSKHLHIFFTIDASGSMSDNCSDNRTKMEHILFTLENMLTIFHEKKDQSISVCIQAFDSKIIHILDNVPNMADSDIEYIKQRIQIIRPGGSTNIELALQNAKTIIEKHKNDNPDHEIVHLFMTDGEISTGNTDKDYLKTLVLHDCTNIFIGYGNQHDSQLLTTLASNSNNDYRFIDALEKAGLVYGEIIHGILYKALSDVELTAENCEIYDFTTNNWVTKLYIGSLASEQNKVFQIRSSSPHESNITIKGRDDDNIVSIHAIVCDSKNNIDLTNFAYRLKTQQLLFEARNTIVYINWVDYDLDDLNDFIEINNIENTEMENIKKIKSKLKSFHKELIEYIKKNNLKSDLFLKTLCDDIYIAYRTIGTKKAPMFITARQSSQGREQSYVCNNIENDFHENPLFSLRKNRRQTMNGSFTLLDTLTLDDLEFEKGDDDSIDNYSLSQELLSPYSTQGQEKTMRTISGL
jgi:Mg-chelatase subunit ChlD